MKYSVKSPLVHDGQRLEIGQTVELDDAVAQPLAQIGVVALEPAEEPKAKGKKAE